MAAWASMIACPQSCDMRKIGASGTAESDVGDAPKHSVATSSGGTTRRAP